MDSADKSKTSMTSKENDEEKEMFNMLQLPTIAENIFRHLPASDLSECAKTCRSWNIIAGSAKKKRRHIYVMSILRRYRRNSSLPYFIPEKFLNLWSESNLAIALGSSDAYADMAILIQEFSSQLLDESATQLAHWKKHYYRSIQEAKRSNELFRNYLPRNCTFVNINLSVHEYCYSKYNDPFRLILIPSITGLEIQPFIIPPPDDTSLPDRRKIELLYVSSENNFLSNDIKCMLVFAHQNERDIEKKTTYAKAGIAEYISEETIIIGGRSSICPISAGIAISGKSVRIECFYINRSSCCVKHCFSVLKQIGLHNEDGIAFLLKQSYFEGVIVRSLWSEYFPKMVLTSIYLDSGLITSTIPSKVSSFQPCNECGKQLNIHDPLDKIITLVFICLSDFNCKIIQV